MAEILPIRRSAIPPDGSWLEEPEEDLAEEAYDDEEEACHCPSHGDDGGVPLVVSEVEARELAAEVRVNSLLFQVFEAAEGIAGEDDASDECDGVSESA